MIVFALATILAAAPLSDPGTPPLPQTAPTGQTIPDGPIQLEDIEVTGSTLDSMIKDFVGEVAAPNRRRGLARWEDNVCIGVANMRPEPAQYIVDRVSTVAEDVGLTPGAPGCTPNVMIVASDDPSALAQDMIEESRRAFRLGGSGMDRGSAALRAFESSDAPVRWWQIAMPTDSETGGRAVRIPGECFEPCRHSIDYAPKINVFAASRLNTQIVDNLFRTLVILDMNQISNLSAIQLADYVAMVTLAQIDPEADTSRYASILNVFDGPEPAGSLTDWDKAYLQGLYDAQRTRKGQRAGRTEIVSSIHRAHEELRAEQD